LGKKDSVKKDQAEEVRVVALLGRLLVSDFNQGFLEQDRHQLQFNVHNEIHFLHTKSNIYS
jgi:hypothetical protein